MNNFRGVDPFKRDKMPGGWLFKALPIFIGFVFLMAISIIGFNAYVAYKFIDKPELAGELAGKIINGYDRTRQ